MSPLWCPVPWNSWLGQSPRPSLTGAGAEQGSLGAVVQLDGAVVGAAVHGAVERPALVDGGDVCLGTPLSAAPAPAGCAGSRTNSSGLQPSTGKCLRGPSSAKQQSCQDWIFLPLDKKRCWLNLQLQSLIYYLFSIIKWPILKGLLTKQHFLDQKFCLYTDNLKFSDLIFFVICSLNHRE